jgi:hypothetical protein
MLGRHTSVNSMINGQKYVFKPKPILATLISKTGDEITIRPDGAKKDVSLKTDSLFKNYEVSNEPLKRLGAVEIDLSSLPLERQNAMDYSYMDDADTSAKRKRIEGGKRSRKSRKSKKSRKSRKSRK